MKRFAPKFFKQFLIFCFITSCVFFNNTLFANAVDETTIEQIVPNEFRGGGDAQSWHADDDSWDYELPFTFTFYGVDYDTIYVNSNGVICFEDYCSSTQIDLDEEENNPMIAPLSMDLRTDRTGNDIFITENSDNVIVRWDVVQYSNESNRLNFEVILYESGNIKFNYGSFSQTLSRTPVVGISKSDGSIYTASVYDGETNLGNVDTAVWGIFGIDIVDFSPISGSQNVAVDENLLITFDRDVVAGSGSIVIRKYSDDSMIEMIDVTSEKVAGWGTDAITINPNATFENNVQYYITIDQNAITDAEETEYDGINNKDEWTFAVRPEGNDFDFDDTFSTKNFIDSEKADAYWNQEMGLFTLGGASGVWTYADRVTEGKEGLQNDNDESNSPKIALNDDDEQMVVWEEDGVIMFTKWDSDDDGPGNGRWETMDGSSEGAEDISSVPAMGCSGEGSGCGDGYCDWEAGEDWMNCPADCEGTTYHIYQNVNNELEEKYNHHFPVNYEGKEFTFTPENNELELLIELRNSPFADIDQLGLTCSGSSDVIDPAYIRYENDHEIDLREDVAKQDLNVIVASENNIEAKWIIPGTCTEEVVLYMYANEYGEAHPFNFNGRHVIGEKTMYEPFWKPSTGHPDGTTYIKITDDDEYIYYDLDITMDNTDDYGKDWLEIAIGDKSFRIDDHDDTYGACPFGTSKKVPYKHQLCAVKIPKSDISGNDFDFTLQYYGTGGEEPPVGGCREAKKPQIYADNDGNPVVAWVGFDNDGEWASSDIFVRKWDDEENEWRTVDGSEEDADIVFDTNLNLSPWAEGRENLYHMISSSEGDPMIVSQIDGGGELAYSQWNEDEWGGVAGSYFDRVDEQISAASLVQLERDSDDYPMILWAQEEGDNGVRLTHWVDGEGFEAFDDSDNSYNDVFTEYGAYSANPRIAVNSSDYPVVVHAFDSEARTIDLHQWNGSFWNMNSIEEYQAWIIRMQIDSMGAPIIVWSGENYESEEDDERGIFAARWNGSEFTRMDGTEGVDYIEDSVYSEVRDVNFVLTSDDRPMVVWSMQEMGSTHFKQWSGSEWVAGDGVSAVSDSLSGDEFTDGLDIVINSQDEPSVVWEEPWEDGIQFSMLPLEIESPKTIVSKKINGSISGIVKAMLTATDVLDGESYINYFLSGNGGADWIEVEKGEEVSFSGISDLRWRADLYAGSVPELHDVHVDYETEFVEPDPDPDPEPESKPEPQIKPEQEEKECTFDAVKDVKKDSANLRVSVDDDYANEKTKFKVEVENLYTDDKETIKLTDKPTDNGKATLLIDGLEEDTEYRFKVSYDEDANDGYLYCPHSKTAKTPTTVVGPEKEEKYPECGNAAKTYTEETAVFTGTFCAVGTENITPEFPTPGQKSTWTCAIDGNTEDCHATREKAPEEPPVVKGGTEPTPEPAPAPDLEPEPVIPPKEPLQVTAAAGLITGTMLAFATSAVPLFTTLPMAAKDIFILPFIGLLGRRRNEQNWGTVFEATTKQPIPGTKLMLTDPTGKEIETTYSDQHGRFGFLTENGSYIIQIEKSKFDPKFTEASDPLYGEVYTGETITIDQSKIIATNIAMSAQNIDWSAYAQKKSQAYKGFFSTFKKWSFIVLFYAGFAATAVITYFFPTPINFVFLTLYTLLFIYDNFFKKKKYGTVESEDKKPIPFAIVSLHDKETTEKKSFAVTDVIGRYYLLSENGSYNMKVKGQPVGGQNFEKQGDIHVRDGLVRKDVKI